MKRAGVLLLCLVGAALFVVLAGGPAPEPGSNADVGAAEARRQQTATELVRKLQDSGVLVRYSCIGNEAYVNPSSWVLFDAEAKRVATLSIAAACEVQNGGNRITIIDNQSGRKLAAYSGLSYTVY